MKDTWHGVAAFLRGDHQVNETKLLGAIGAAELRTMQAEELTQYFNGPAGYLGPVGLKPDTELRSATGSPSSSTSRSKAARTWSAAPTSSTTTCAT